MALKLSFLCAPRLAFHGRRLGSLLFLLPQRGTWSQLKQNMADSSSSLGKTWPILAPAFRQSVADSSFSLGKMWLILALGRCHLQNSPLRLG